MGLKRCSSRQTGDIYVHNSFLQEIQAATINKLRECNFGDRGNNKKTLENATLIDRYVRLEL